MSGKIAVQIRLRESVARKIKRVAEAEGLSLTAWCRRAILLRLKTVKL